MGVRLFRRQVCCRAKRSTIARFFLFLKPGDDVRSVVLGAAGLGGPPWVGASTRPHHLPRHDGGLHQRTEVEPLFIWVRRL